MGKIHVLVLAAGRLTLARSALAHALSFIFKLEVTELHVLLENSGYVVFS